MSKTNYYFSCPRCGQDRDFRVPTGAENSGLGCLVLLTGGVIPALLVSGRDGRRILCVPCGHLLRQPAPPSASAATLASVIGLVLVVAGLVVLFAIQLPDRAPSLPEFWGVPIIEESLRAQPRLWAGIIVLVTSLITLACLIGGIVSNRRFRRDHPNRIRVPKGDEYRPPPSEESRLRLEQNRQSEERPPDDPPKNRF